jgi:biopolymer transport protein ExbD
VSFTQHEARSIIRKAVGRVPEGESIRHLNIMPMMDMMTILLVAFIFQVATSATALTAGTVALPRTLTSDELKEDTTTVIITPTGVVVEGKPIVTVNNGDVDASEKEGGALGVGIPTLRRFLGALYHDHLTKAQQSAPDPSKPPEPPELLIIADRTTPYGLLIEVLFSAKCFTWGVEDGRDKCKDPGYKHFRLIVQKQFPTTKS